MNGKPAAQCRNTTAAFRRRLALTALLVFLFPALACNLPLAPAAPDPYVAQAVEQTLAARLLETAQPGQTIPPPLDPPSGGPAATLPPVHTAPPGAAVPAAQEEGGAFRYVTLPGDTVAGLAGRFGLDPARLFDPMQYPPHMLLPTGMSITIPNQTGEPRYSGALLPDSEIVYSPASLDFPVEAFIQAAGGFLSGYSEQVDDELLNGAEIVRRVSVDLSINPRLLVAFLEYRSQWVFSHPPNPNTGIPIGFNASGMTGLYKELTLVARQLTIGYYGWRSGKVTELEFIGGSRQRIVPTVNAGTAALQYLFAKLYPPPAWAAELYDPGTFLIFYQQRFGDPWQRAAEVGPMLPEGLVQPELELPFLPGETWTMTGGPHSAWGIGSPWGGIDFAPANVEKGCEVSRFWTTAAAPGLVVRSERGMVLLDLDGDGSEQTGWVLLYLHVAERERASAGDWLEQDGLVGHPSCEGGVATGTHVHIVRKYNGEWFGADSPVPFVLSGWQVWPAEKPYRGSLVKGDQVVTSRLDGSRTSLITR